MSAAPEHPGSPPSPPTPSEVPTDPIAETIELGTETTPTASLQPGTPEKSGQSSEEDDDEGSRALDPQGKPKLGLLEQDILEYLKDLGFLFFEVHDVDFKDGFVRLHFESPPVKTKSEVHLQSWKFHDVEDDVHDLGPLPSKLSQARFVVEKVCGQQHLRLVADKAQKRAREEDPQDEEELDIVGGVDELPPMTNVTIEAERPLKRARSEE